ncbi:MAG: CoA pyrophosphatase [Ignavibacteria bacterium]|jgi:8-oxo-dGTP pyrophosphatase MutT (NUDIX family)|nr:CoA pyrophosphatase [Ignavibacteria bacterium]
MNAPKIIERLRKRLTEPLPGDAPRSLLAPTFNGVSQRPAMPSMNAKKCAVLVLIYERNGDLQIVFTLRNNNLHSHSGQISYPGGKTEYGENPVKTALRETFEEIGVPEHQIDVLGTLTPMYVLPSNSLITPVVGFSNTVLDFIVNKDEVEEVFTKPIGFFKFTNIEMRKLNANGEVLDVPYWAVHPTVPLWGATAMILAEFVEVFQKLMEVK